MAESNSTLCKVLVFICLSLFFCINECTADTTIRFKFSRQDSVNLRDTTFAISGSILDEDGNPMANASVTVQRKDSTIVSSTLPSMNGSFTLINLPYGDYRLKISNIGYLDCFRELSSPRSSVDLGIITMSKNMNQLAEVNVVGNKPFIERKLDRTVVNISGHVKQIGGNANDAMKIAPGVRSVNGNISIVGKGNVLIMLNEKIIQLSGNDLSEFLNTIPSESIERLEVITNPPAKYDASGNTGYINIVLKKKNVEGYSGMISGSLGNAAHGFGNVAGNFNLNTKTIRMNFSPSFGFNRYTTWSEQDIAFPDEKWNQHVKTKNNNKSLGLNYNLIYELATSTTIDFLYNYSRSPNNGLSFNNSKFISTATGRIDSILQTNTDFGSITQNHIIDLSSTTNLDSSGKRLLLNINYFRRSQPSLRDFQTSALNENGVQYALYDSINSSNRQQIEVYTASSDFIIPVKSYRFSAGMKVSFIKSLNDAKYGAINEFIDAQNSIFEYKENTQALYASLSKVGEEWSYQIGLRGEFTQAKGNSISLNQTNSYDIFQLFPTSFLGYKPDKNNTLTLTHGRRISRPGYSWVNPFRLYNSINSFQEGNPYLKPYYTNNFEIGHQFKDILTSSLYYSITDNKFDQLTIQEKQFGNLFQGTVNRNFLNEKSFGISESFYFNRLSWLESINEIYLYHNKVSSTDPVTTKEMGGTSAFLSTDNTLSFDKTGTFKVNISFWYQFPEVSGVDKVDAYHSLDAGVATKLLSDNLSFALNFSDIFKSANPSWESLVAGIPQRYYQYYDSRRFRFSFVYRFSKGKDKDNTKSKGNEEWNRAYY